MLFDRLLVSALIDYFFLLLRVVRPGTSCFCVTFSAIPNYDQTQLVIGVAVSGIDVLDEMRKYGTAQAGNGVTIVSR